MQERTARLKRIVELQRKLWENDHAQAARLEVVARGIDGEIDGLAATLQSGGLCASLFPDLVLARLARMRESRKATLARLEAHRAAALEHGKRFKLVEGLLDEADAALQSAKAAKEMSEIVARAAASKPGEIDGMRSAPGKAVSLL